MTKFNWTEEAILQMLALAKEGRSSREIALILGTSRNSVIGKLHREEVRRGIKIYQPSAPARPRVNILPAKPISPELERNTTPKRTYTRAIPPPSLSATGVGTVLRPVKLHLKKGKLVGILNVTGCRWPIYEDESVIGGEVFCNAKQRDGSSYCPHHAEVNRASYSAELIRRTVRSTLSVLKKRAA